MDETAETALFTSGTEGYHTFRIPALLATTAGTLLAFCEGRDSADDHGEIALLLKRSMDNGETWSALQVVWADAPNTCGNPCAVQDPATGIIWLAMNWNQPGRYSQEYFRDYDGRHVYITSSQDDGRTWAPPRDITAEVKLRHWGWHATGPGVGIALRQDPHAGRLLIPCNHSEMDGDAYRFGAHVLYSDDHGQSWQLGGVTESANLDECHVVELRDGRVLLNARTNDPSHPRRRIAVSDDGGLSWGPVLDDPYLTDPTDDNLGCQACLISALDGTLLFSHPAGDTRARMSVRVSTDDGASWPAARQLYAGPSAYSCLACLSDGRIACLYERGQQQANETITFARFPRP